MFKRMMTVLLCLCMLHSIFTVAVFAEEEETAATETVAEMAEPAPAPAAEPAPEAPKAETPEAEEPKAEKDTQEDKKVIIGVIEEPGTAQTPESDSETTPSTVETQESTEATEETTEPTEESTEPTEESTEPTEETIPEEETILEEEEAYRVYITTNLEALGNSIREGDVVVLTAHLEGFEDEQYTLEWQYSTDDTDWHSVSEVEGVSVSDEICQVVVSAENAYYYWRVLVTIQ